MFTYSYPQQEESLTLPITPELLKSNEGGFIETTIKNLGTVTGRLVKYHDLTGMADIEIIGSYDDFTSVHYTDLVGISPLIPESTSGHRRLPGPYSRPSRRPFISPTRRPYIRLLTRPLPGPYQGPLPGPYSRPLPGPYSVPLPGPYSIEAFRPFPAPFLGSYPRPYLVPYPRPYPGRFPGPYLRPFTGLYPRP